MSLEALVMEMGIFPLSLFSSNSKYFKFGSEYPISAGNWPESWLLSRLRTLTVEILKIGVGMGPFKLLVQRTRQFRFCRLPISVGISPAKVPILSYKPKLWINVLLHDYVPVVWVNISSLYILIVYKLPWMNQTNDFSELAVLFLIIPDQKIIFQ